MLPMRPTIPGSDASVESWPSEKKEFIVYPEFEYSGEGDAVMWPPEDRKTMWPPEDRKTSTTSTTTKRPKHQSPAPPPTGIFGRFGSWLRRTFG